MALVKWDPFRDVAELQNRINRLFDDSFGPSRDQADEMNVCAWRPATDIYETETGVILAVELPGVGKATQNTLSSMGIAVVGDLLAFELRTLEDRFGRFGVRLYNLARGVDHNEVRPDRPVKSISSEQTFETDLALGELVAPTQAAAERTWAAAAKSDREGRTVVLKLKTSEFQTVSRSITPTTRPNSLDELTHYALELLERVDLPPATRYRLVGVGLANFIDSDEVTGQSELFA
jgi:DNA polymerase-4